MGKLIDADALIFDLKTSFMPQSMDYTNAQAIALRWLREAPVVDAVEVTGQDVQFLIDALYYHVRWMIAGGLDKPECGYDERLALLERLKLFEREHFPDMKADTEI